MASGSKTFTALVVLRHAQLVVALHRNTVASVGQSVRRIQDNGASPLKPDDARETCPSRRLVDAAVQPAHRATVPARD